MQPLSTALLGILASSAMAALYARGGYAWLLGFVFLIPWLRCLDRSRTVGHTLLLAWGMALAYTAGVFTWFGVAVGDYARIGAPAGVALLLLGAPLFQPQFLAFALVRHGVVRRHGAVTGALAGCAAWVVCEWLVPRLLGDTISYGLYPSALIRQGAAVGGAAGLTLLLLLTNEALSIALARRARGLRALAAPLACAASVPLAMAAYGLAALHAPPQAGQPLRIGLVQSNIAAYERQRQEKGAHAVVREVLDTHFAMSYDAVERQRADAVMWSETAYPTTFGHPKSEAGAEFDEEIRSIITAAGVPFIFGTYDRDQAGEYNAAAFVLPGSGLMGFYRKTRLFPLTEYVPALIDGPLARRLLPWAGDWRAGNGARVFPLTLKGGREIPVLPLICYDDVDTSLALAGARLGAQAILTMSNDSWFSAGTLGAQMHQNAAAFRSIETRLPQFRVTTNGFSAAFDAFGNVLAGSRMGERTLVVAQVTAAAPAPTLMVKWGNWVGVAATVFLGALAAWSALRWWQPRTGAAPQEEVLAWPLTVAVLPPAARLGAGLLRAAARAGLFYICVDLLLNEALRTNTLAQVRLFATLVLAPGAAAWCVLFLFSAKATLADGALLLTRSGAHEAIPLASITAMRLWRVLLPCPGLSLHADRQRRWSLALANPQALAAVLVAAGVAAAAQERSAGRPASASAVHAYVMARLAVRRSWLDHPVVRYALLSLALAIPAFHLQQQIAFGSPLGEYYTYGFRAYATGFAIWWAAWAIGVALCDAVLRTLIAATTMAAAVMRPARAGAIHRSLHSAGHAALFLGMPAWFLLTVYGT